MKNYLKIPMALLLASSFLIAKQLNPAYVEFDYEKELSEIMTKNINNLKRLQFQQEKSEIINKNDLLMEIQERQRAKFILKDYKKMDVYVRGNYTVVDENYILKNPSGWRRILVKQTNIWE